MLHVQTLSSGIGLRYKWETFVQSFAHLLYFSRWSYKLHLYVNWNSLQIGLIQYTYVESDRQYNSDLVVYIIWQPVYQSLSPETSSRSPTDRLVDWILWKFWARLILPSPNSVALVNFTVSALKIHRWVSSIIKRFKLGCQQLMQYWYLHPEAFSYHDSLTINRFLLKWIHRINQIVIPLLSPTDREIFLFRAVRLSSQYVTVRVQIESD